MQEQEYIEKRLEDQISWYDKKSIANQSLFKRLRILEIVFATLIPLLSIAFEVFNFLNDYHALIFGVIGLIISVLASIISFGKYQELWQSYRTTCESLKKEKFLFYAKARPYAKNNRYVLLVERVESLISKENTNWSEMINSEENEK